MILVLHRTSGSLDIGARVFSPNWVAAALMLVLAANLTLLKRIRLPS